eukprot:TRINITY_DN1657_c0_g2_i1.p1 TRINITY_DN1657_c0_g2~~TRINITY_DN1657_c0_g2_i1.p1  ORF type:complete len:212 (-),score=81.88 TRINITY_DN1657_c0_g2_i1:286-921(-)
MSENIEDIEDIKDQTEEELEKKQEEENAKQKVMNSYEGQFEVPTMTLSTTTTTTTTTTTKTIPLDDVEEEEEEQEEKQTPKKKSGGGGDTIMPKDQGGREKVVLEQGHSHLDWLRLTNDPKKDLSGVGGQLAKYTKTQVKQHKSADDAWTIIRGVVYNITPYLKFHPGGEKKLMMVAGRDGTALFNKYHAWVNIEFMMAKCVVGFLVAEED